MLVVKLYPWQKHQNGQQGEQVPQGLAGGPANTASAQDALVMELLRRRVVSLNTTPPPKPRPDDDIPEWGKAYLADWVEPDVAAKPAGGALSGVAQGQEGANTAQAKHRDAAQNPEPRQIHRSIPQIAGQKVREFDGFTQGQEPARHYYVVGRRPLDSKDWVKALYRDGPKPGPVEHRHLIGSNGNNFGTAPGGVFTEKAELYSQYVYADQKKYDAECIEEAKQTIDAQNRAELETTGYFLSEGKSPVPWLVWHNCQHYVDDVIQEAERIAKRKGLSLYVE